MVDVNDYAKGKMVKNALIIDKCIKLIGIPVVGNLIKQELIKKMGTLKVRVITLKTASKLIYGSKNCAVGERSCMAAYKNSKYTESIFLDELATEMSNTRKARALTPTEAVKILEKYPENPLILSKVSGKYMEICRSEPKTCICWKMNKKIPEFHLKKL